MEVKVNIRSYICENDHFFKIPAYQRGYKWGVPKSKKNEHSDTAASILINDILNAKQHGKDEYFIQGVTAFETETDIILIDGQQRTTTLFLLLHLLMNIEEKRKYLFLNKEFKLKYEVREDSYKYLKALCNDESTHSHEKQDIYYFKKAIESMEKIIRSYNIEHEDLQRYILDNVFLFYIKVPESQASNIFTMLNGAKAFMKTDELIKADFLSKISQVEENSNDEINNALRSQYARQWDKWLYWWNQPQVKNFFKSESNPMGLLLYFFYKKRNHINEKNKTTIAFKEFQNLFIADRQNAKNNFEELRKLQKKFEDLFNTPHFYNHLGLILFCAKDNTEAEEKSINYFIDNFKNKELIKKYTLLKLINVSHEDVINNEKLKNDEKIINLLEVFKLNNIYNDEVWKRNALPTIISIKRRRKQ